MFSTILIFLLVVVVSFYDFYAIVLYDIIE